MGQQEHQPQPPLKRSQFQAKCCYSKSVKSPRHAPQNQISDTPLLNSPHEECRPTEAAERGGQTVTSTLQQPLAQQNSTAGVKYTPASCKTQITQQSRSYSPSSSQKRFKPESPSPKRSSYAMTGCSRIMTPPHNQRVLE